MLNEQLHTRSTLLTFYGQYYYFTYIFFLPHSLLMHSKILCVSEKCRKVIKLRTFSLCLCCISLHSTFLPLFTQEKLNKVSLHCVINIVYVTCTKDHNSKNLNNQTVTKNEFFRSVYCTSEPPQF